MLPSMRIMLFSLIVAFPAWAVQPFIAPAELSGSMDIKLYPTENISSGSPVLVTFGVPFTRGSLADVATIRVLAGAVEIPACVELQTPWRHLTDPAIDGKSVRVARVQIAYTFTTVFPGNETIQVEWGGTPPAQSRVFLDPRSAWHLVTSGSFDAADGVYEPDVYAVLPREVMCKGILKPTRMHEVVSDLPETREEPLTVFNRTDWGKFERKDHAELNNFYSLLNEDEPEATEDSCLYKTDYEPWLYDRSATMFISYFRNGYFRFLREAVRAAEFYKNNVYDDTQTSTSNESPVGMFKLKNPDPNGYMGANGGMYSYNECLAYCYWLTGDEAVLPYVHWTANSYRDGTVPYGTHYIVPRVNTRWSSSTTGWTERHTSFKILSTSIAYELFGSTLFTADYLAHKPTSKGLLDSVNYKESLLEYIQDFIWHQNGAGGQITGQHVDGGLWHRYIQHEWTQPEFEDSLIVSPWMSCLAIDALLRGYALSEDVDIANFIRRMGGMLLAASHHKDSIHGYFQCEYESLNKPYYLMYSSGEVAYTNDSDGEHAMDIMAGLAWSEYFNILQGSSDATRIDRIADLNDVYSCGFKSFIRDSSAVNYGKMDFRVSPFRKPGWEHRTSGSLTWLMDSIDPSVAVNPLSMDKQLPVQVTLDVFPNPFATQTVIRYQIKTAGHTLLQVFDLEGELVADLVNATQPRGEYAVEWQPLMKGSGTYLLRLSVDGEVCFMRISLIQ